MISIYYIARWTLRNLLFFFWYRRAQLGASGTTYAIHIQKSDVLVRVTTVKW